MVVESSSEQGLILRAGRIAAEAREYAAGLLRPGASARAVCEEVEDFIVRRGGQPAFPCNFSVNEIAAHYTPGIRDDVRLQGDEVVKIDVGVHIDGFIADTATTVDLSGRWGRLLEAVRSALEAVVSTVKPGISLYMIGRTIETTIKRHGYRPIRNLSGHTIGRYLIHAGTTIPNYADRSSFYKRIRPGTLFAVEPFGTNGKGLVREGSTTNIYSWTGRTPRKPLTSEEQQLLQHIAMKYRTLPFTPRWLEPEYGPRVEETIRSLAGKGALIAYPILVEAGKGTVAQFEHTFLALNDKVIVTTLSKENT